MGTILLTCFIIGLFFLMLFSDEGRGCLGGIIGILFSALGIIIVGAIIIFFLVTLIIA